MSGNRWNDDVAYVFSIHRTIMQILGLWPLQKRTVFQMTRCILTALLQWGSFIFLFMEFTGNYRDAGASIEAILFSTCIMTTAFKHLFVSLNQDKLARNINAVIDDWSLAREDEETYKIMKKQAFISRLSTSFVVYSTDICGAIFMFAVLLLNAKQMFFQDVNLSNDSAINTTNWILLIPSGTLGNKINGLQFTILIILQHLQIITVCMSESIVDCLYITLILHLAGQLKVLERNFQAFASKSDIDINYRKNLITLINRHCKLTELNQNIEDTFHLIILLQFIIATLLLALIGLRVLICLRDDNYVELAKAILTLNFVFMEALVYSYGGDCVQRRSEGIFNAMFTGPWCTLPATLMKDLNFAMMRSSYPIRLSAGKFFYANREAMLTVLKTAASYISVLRLMLKE